MRTKGPLLLMAIFLLFLGAFIMWGATILLHMAGPPGIMLMLIALFAGGAGIYFLFKIIGHLESVRQLIHRSRHEYIHLESLSKEDILRLENELVSVNKWVRRNMVFGAIFILVACVVPAKFLGLHNFIHSLGHGGGNQTLVQTTGGLIIFALVLCVEAFLLYNARVERKNIRTDLYELKKIRLKGVVKGIQTERFNKQEGTLVISVEGMELERPIALYNRDRFAKGTEVAIVLALHSQSILGIEPV